MELMVSEITMSSREIADLVESRHDSVKRCIERLASSGVVSFTPSVETSHVGSGSRPVEVYRVGKRDSYVIVAQLSPEFTARLVDRWQELESAAAKPVLPQNYKEALLALVAEVEAREQVEATLALAAPKAEVYDRVIDRTNLLNATQVAEQVRMSAVKLNRHLDAIGGVYSKAVKRGRVFVQSWIDGGYGEVKQTEQGYPQALFTPKGAARIVELLVSEGLI